MIGMFGFDSIGFDDLIGYSFDFVISFDSIDFDDFIGYSFDCVIYFDDLIVW